MCVINRPVTVPGSEYVTVSQIAATKTAARMDGTVYRGQAHLRHRGGEFNGAHRGAAAGVGEAGSTQRDRPA